ncbi:MAG TPA: hypothetical protein VI159_05585 [Gemmatimonadales bacterium]
MVKPSRLYRWFERAILGAGMTLIAFVIERRLLKALKQGKARGDEPAREAQLATTQQIADQP